MEPGIAKPQLLNLRRRLLRLVRIMLYTVLGFLAAASLLIYFFQGHLIYFPSRDYADTPRDARLDFEDLTLTTTDGVAIAAWYVPCPDAKGTVLFCHANAGNMADRIHALKSFHDLGYHVLIFDYRGYGRSAGRPSETGTYRDAEAAWRWLTESKGEQPDQIVLFGESLGGAVAIETARRHAPAALVVECTFTSLIDVGRVYYPWLPVKLLCRHRYDSITKVGAIRCPKLFIHARDDEIVPYEIGRRLFEAAAEPKRFLETPGGHNTGGFQYNWDYTQKVGDYLDEVMPAN